MSDCPFSVGDRVTTVYRTIDFEPNGKTFTLLSIRPYRYAASGWMVTIDSIDVPEIDSSLVRLATT